MADAAKLIESFSSLIWPLLALLVIILFRPAVGAVIESAKSRKFTIKIGGQELSMEDANSIQQKFITDLQSQVLEIKNRMETAKPLPRQIKNITDLMAKNLTGIATPEAKVSIDMADAEGLPGDSTTEPKAAAEPSGSITPVSVKSILWVDDQPKNNSYFVQQLAEKHVKVDTAMSTAEGMKAFSKTSYGAVVSDMGRTENGVYDEKAGFELLQSIRRQNRDIPFIIYSSSRSAQKYSEEANRLGVTVITSSPTEMFGILRATIGDNEP